MAKQALINKLSEWLSRTSPFVITEFHLPEKERLLDNIELKIGYTTTINRLVQAYSLYDLLKQNADDADKTILVKMDLLKEDSGFWEILEGAMGFDPNAGKLSEVRYGHYPAFTFRGKLILCTDLTKEQIKRHKGLAFINHYCHFI